MLAVLSGKGGTGKSTISVGLSHVFSRPLYGADVESPTTMIIYGDEPIRKRPVYRRIAEVDEEQCIACGICSTRCPFGAILMLNKAYIDPEVCEGCLACIDSCPVDAIKEKKLEIGEIRYGKYVVEGALKPGEKEGRVVLEELLKETPREAIVDGSPGASPLVYRIARKADEVILVVEPIATSIADASRVLEILAKLEKPTAIVANKVGLGNVRLIERLGEKYGVPIVLRVSFHRELLLKRPLEVEEFLNEVSNIKLEFSIPKAFSKPKDLPEAPRGGKFSKHITIVSGKGGTGKTLLAIGLSRYLGVPLVDADVDAPDSYMLLADTKRKYAIRGRVYRIDPNLCDGCGECVKACYNYSIEPIDNKYRISPELCEGCGMCVNSCPRNAIEPIEIPFGYIGEGEGYIVGESEIGRAGIGDFVLKLKSIASEKYEKFVLDGSPGSGCTTISALNSSSLAIIVVEPTEESISSAKRVAEIANHFGIKTLVVVNKRLEGNIEEFLNKIKPLGEFLGHIPFDKSVFEAYAEGKWPENSKAAEAIRKISQRLLEYLTKLGVEF